MGIHCTYIVEGAGGVSVFGFKVCLDYRSAVRRGLVVVLGLVWYLVA